MKKNEVRMGLALLAVILLVLGALTGCQLAKVDAGDDAVTDDGERDRLVGIMVTTEWVDLFDSEAWVEDNLDQILEGDVTVDAESSRKYQQRRYATMVDCPVYDESGKEISTTKEFVFEGIEGVMFYSATVYEEDGQSYVTSNSDKGLYIEKNHLSVTDAGTMVEMEGTIYVVAGAGSPIYCMYPIYQEPDGDMYLINGNSVSFGTETEGANMSMFYQEEITATAGGEATEAVSSMKVNLEVVNRPERVVVSQLDKESQLVSRVEYPAGQVPGEIAPEASAEYIIVEMFKQGADGETVSRQMCDKEDDGFRSMAAGDRGFCEQTYTSIGWEK